jgi:hypothetical protein
MNSYIQNVSGARTAVYSLCFMTIHSPPPSSENLWSFTYTPSWRTGSSPVQAYFFLYSYYGQGVDSGSRIVSLEHQMVL